MREETLLVLSTFGSAEEARRVAQAIITERLAACANILPGVQSIYRWKGEVEEASEVMVIFKTQEDRYYRLEARIQQLHSYELPEIVALRADKGFLPYLQWVNESTCDPLPPST